MKILNTSLFFIAFVCSIQAQEIPNRMMSDLSNMLDLSDKQQDKVTTLVTKYRTNINYILLKNEDEEEPNVGAMIAEIREERDTYREDLQGILSPNQYEVYLAKVDQIFTNMFNDLAEIRLMNIKDKADLSDKQIENLTPIVGESMSKTVHLLFEKASGKISLPKKISIGKKMKKIEKEKRARMEGILTPLQMASYDKLKKEQKAARKEK